MLKKIVATAAATALLGSATWAQAVHTSSHTTTAKSTKTASDGTVGVKSTTKTTACRDAKGKFAKCSSVAASSSSSGQVTKDKSGRCHVASGPKKGQFTKCP